MHRSLNSRRGSALVIVVIFTAVLIAMVAPMADYISTGHVSGRLDRDQLQAEFIAQSAVNWKVAEIALNSTTYDVEEDYQASDGMDAPEVIVGFFPIGMPVAFGEGGGEVMLIVEENADGTIMVNATGDYKDAPAEVEVTLEPGALTGRFNMALFGDIFLSAGGNFYTDSFNSDLGAYGAVIAGVPNLYANGDMGTNGTMTVFGSGEAHGDIIVTSPPYTAATAAALQAALYAAGQLAPPNVVTIESKVVLEPVVYDPPAGLGYTAIPANSNQVINGSADPENPTVIRASTLNKNPGKTLTINGHVKIYVDSTIDIKGAVILNAGGSVLIKQGAGTITMNATSAVNLTGYAKNFSIESATTSDIKMNGGGAMTGTLYAPSAPIKFNGTNEVYGSMVGKQIEVVGTADFHYDESLGNLAGGSPGSYEVVSWTSK